MELKTYEELQNENINLKEEIEKLKATILNQELQINWFTKYVFGSKSEKTSKKEENIIEGTQCSLFSVPEEIKEEMEEKTKEIIVHRTMNRKEKKAGIKKASFKDAEIITEEYTLEDAQSVCPVCGANLELLCKKVARQEVEYIPAKIILKNYVTNIYKCPECGKEGTEGTKKEKTTIVKTKTPRPLLTHSFVSPSLASEVIYQKYYMGAPLYRQEKMWDELGLVLPRNMMANWCIKINEYYLEPLYKLMLNKIKEKVKVLHCDETTIQVNKEKGKKASSNSYMWVITPGEKEEVKGVIFSYSKSRSGEVAEELLKDYKEILVTDGYAGYNKVEEKVTHAECWAHARRYFYNSIPLINKKLDTTATGYEGVCIIDELFKKEKEIDKQVSENSSIEKAMEEKLKLRQEQMEPILKKFYEWVSSTSEKYILNKKLKEALTYATNQKKQLSEFIKDGKIPLTNSKCERAIRPFAVHRKNWLFADTEKGAKANAVYYSFIESAKVNNLNIYKYINYLLRELPQLEGEQNEKDIEKYLPWSKELPKEILNYQGTYEELNFEE